MVVPSINWRKPRPIPPPITTHTEPPVTARAFAVIRDLLSIINGIPAESPARINRLTPNATSTKTVISIPVFPWKIRSAIIDKVVALLKFANIIARCLETRSRIVPTNGPINEYGRRTTANAKAALSAFACRSGENKTNEAKALWNIPSVI